MGIADEDDDDDDDDDKPVSSSGSESKDPLMRLDAIATVRSPPRVSPRADSALVRSQPRLYRSPLPIKVQ